MKKYFRFLSVATIIAIVASISVMAPLSANAGSLTNIRVSLSNYGVSTDLDPVYVDMTARVTLATELSGVVADEIVITFQEYSGDEHDEFDVNDTNLTAADIDVFCGETNEMDIDTATVVDGDGTASDTITLVMGDDGDYDTCSAAGVVKIVINTLAGDGDELRTPYTEDIVSPAGYRIKFETQTTADALEDTGVAAVYIFADNGNQVNIYGTVEPVLSMALDTNTCDLGVLSKDNFRTCGYNLTVGTNADLGYGAYIKSDGDLDDDNTSVIIQKESQGNANNQIDNTAPLLSETEYGLGVYTSDTVDVYPDYRTPGWGSCDAVEGTLTYNVPVEDLNDTTAQRFAYSAGPVDATTTGKTELCHVARISGDQASGSFTQTVTITVVGNF